MIIKKAYAQSATPSQRAQRAFQASAATEEASPYEAPLRPEDFENGQLPERRRTDRRHGFRREEEEQELISQAHEEANAIREAAAQEGYEQGLAQAKVELNQLNDAIQGLFNAREDALKSASGDLARMAVAIAEHIIKAEVSCDPALVMATVQHTIQQVGRDQKSIYIKVNPVDLMMVREGVKIDENIPASVEVMVNEDNSVDPGSCMIETRAGMIDARFTTQLGVLKQLLAIGGPV